MRGNKELLIATKPFAQEIRWQSWWHLWTTLAVLGLLVAATCSEAAWWLRLPFSVASGLVVVRFFVLYHDHQHGAYLRDSRLADAIMWAFGLSLLNPSSVWKRSHDHHHAHNSKLSGPNVGSFPLMTVDDYKNATRWQRLLYNVERHPVTIALGYVTVFFIGMCLIPFLANPRRHIDAAFSIALHGCILFWFATDEMDDLWLAAVIPFFVGSGVGAYLFFAQHNFPGARFRIGREWDYTYAALHSSSFIRMGPVLNWCTGNIGYHHVHHLNARIPFYRLPEAMASIEELQSPTTISLRPRDILACLRLKFWDPEREQLVPASALL